MNGLYLQYEKLWKVQTVNVLCIVDQNHRRTEFERVHFRNSEGI